MKLKDEQKYDRLIQAAVTVLAQGGLANFSTTKVAKAAGIPQSNVYIYFKNKQSLLEAVFQTTIHQESIAVVQTIDTKRSLPEQIVASISALYRFCLAEPEVVAAIQVLTEDIATKQTMHLKRDDTANQQIQTMLTDGVATGVLRKTDLNLLRYFLTRPVFRFAEGVRQGLYTDTPKNLTDLTNMIMGAVLLPATYQNWLITND
ncbi:TetR/AcrR family transcriptional regulator [Lactiplantibacillus herbarum]|uniref:TetR/AcrR family transcriptional regulator n=1 Tax=Lactiplantibacillus herbarum TaxID=1670446 RepID=UPI00069E8408|nr:TetR/AcrR family transcriptional regulator [Lactiplantibacillus herbarum]